MQEEVPSTSPDVIYKSSNRWGILIVVICTIYIMLITYFSFYSIIGAQLIHLLSPSGKKLAEFVILIIMSVCNVSNMLLAILGIIACSPWINKNVQYRFSQLFIGAVLLCVTVVVIMLIVLVSLNTFHLFYGLVQITVNTLFGLCSAYCTFMRIKVLRQEQADMITKAVY
jgi:hypothetical protein